MSVVIDVDQCSQISDTPQAEPPPPMPPMNHQTVPDPKLALDEKAKFWEEYSEYARKCDAELVRGLREDLQGLLTFAGLFSAVNTAVIIESIKDLKADATETTNDLLRDLIRNVRDPSNSTYEDTQPSNTFKVTAPALRANMFFFASLCCSLCTAFGAVLSKQWLDTYENDGPPKPLPDKCRERHLKFMGVEKWYLEGIIQTLPSLLQISLFLFLIGLTDWIWHLNKMVAALICSFAIITFLFYISTTAISIFDPSSPFQNGFSRKLRKPIIAFQGMCRRYGVRAACGFRSHKWHCLWTWPFILISAVTSTQDYMKETPPIQLVKESMGLRTGFFAPRTKLEWLINRLVSEIYEAQGLILGDGFFAIPVRVGLVALALPLLILRRLEESTSSADSAGCLADLGGSDCVLWLVKDQLATTRVSARVIEAAMTLDHRVFECHKVLKLLILAILNPRKQADAGNSRWFLDVPVQRLHQFLPFLKQLLTQIIKSSEVMLQDESGRNCDLELWSLLCQEVWMMVGSAPEDRELLESAALVLNSNHIAQCSIKPIPPQSLQYLRKRLDPYISKLQETDHPIDTRLVYHAINCLTVLSSACAAYVEQSHDTYPETYYNILDHSLFLSLKASVELLQGSDGDQWRGRLLLLWLESCPDTVIPILKPVASEFAEVLRNWETSDQNYWKNPHQELLICRRSLYLDTLHLLLVDDHQYWSDHLQSSCDYLQDLLLVQRRWQRLSDELRNVNKDLRKKRIQLIWGYMLTPLHHFLAIWSKINQLNPEVASQYQTREWSEGVRSAVISLAKLRSISINYFCDNIMPAEIKEMMESIANYAQSCRRHFLPISEFLKSFRDLAKLLIQEYDPTELRFSNSRRTKQALEFWEIPENQQSWKEHILRISQEPQDFSITFRNVIFRPGS
ncbi:hypothetical protein FRC03_012488 [Tulasnella sp. 419]|nr:hypothetical protein FRC03_012488 [Tulasnella sp. 419]